MKSKKDVAGLLRLGPFNLGEGSENLSEEIDDILYGLKKDKKCSLT